MRLEKQITHTQETEIKAFRDGRDIEKLFNNLRRLTDKIKDCLFLESDFLSSFIEDSKLFAEKYVEQISDIEKKYFNSHIELAKLKQEFDEVHKEACYFFASHYFKGGQK